MSRKAKNPFGLSDQQIAFADAYHRGGCSNAVQAAKDAKYSKNYAEKNANNLLVIVGEYLDTLIKKTAARNDAEREKNLAALIAMRDVDLLDVLTNANMGDIDGEDFPETLFVPAVKDLRKVPKVIRQCIASIKQTAHGVEVKFYDKIKAIEVINRMCGYNEPDRLEHSVSQKEELISKFFNGDE